MTASTTDEQETRGQPGRGEESSGSQSSAARGAQRPLALTGAIAACAAAGAGLAALTLVAAVGWIAAPHASVGGGLPGVLRTAIQLWLVGHHVGFKLHAASLHGAGNIGLLPLGLVLLPGALLWRSGRWVVRTGQVQRLRHVGYAALALALPYGLVTGSLAVASRTALSAPSPAQAAGAGFGLAFVAGGLGGVRALAPWRQLIALLQGRARCLVVGVTGSLAVLAGAGALLTGVSLVVHAGGFRLASVELSPGPVGSALLLLAALAYLPNAVIWAIAYMLGPGFAFGAGTVVAPTGSVLGPLPMFPMLAALPSGSPGPHPAAPGPAELALLAVPYLAGAFGGLLTVRTAPSPAIEVAPLWGFAAGGLAGLVLGALAVFSGGPLGTGRLSAVGPSGWQVALVAVLEMGIAAAITAGLANWLLLRRRSAPVPTPAAAPSTTGPADPATGPAPAVGSPPAAPHAAWLPASSGPFRVPGSSESPAPESSGPPASSGPSWVRGSSESPAPESSGLPASSGPSWVRRSSESPAPESSGPPASSGLSSVPEQSASCGPVAEPAEPAGHVIYLRPRARDTGRAPDPPSEGPPAPG